MIGYPLFFKIDNDRDECSFCHSKGKLIKSLRSGHCLCVLCVDHITLSMSEEPLALPMHQPIGTDKD